MKITLVLHNIRSTYNVGAIIRTVEGLGIDEVALSGYTPRYNDPNLLPHLREKLNHQIAKSALGAEELVSQKLVDGLPDWIERQKTDGVLILGLENNLNAEEEQRKIELGSWCDDAIFGRVRRVRRLLPSMQRDDLVKTGVIDASPKNTEHRTNTQFKHLILILGEEVNGIPPEIRTLCDYFLEIPMYGRKESFNVSVAAGIAMWELKKSTKILS